MELPVMFLRLYDATLYNLYSDYTIIKVFLKIYGK